MGEWKMVRLGDVCTKITDGSHNPPKGVDTSDYLMLSSKNVYDNRISFEEPRYLSSEDFIIENKRTNVEVGDVLLTIVGTVGRCAVVNSESPYFTLQRSVAVIKPKSNVIISRYLMYSLQSMRKKLEAEARGVAQKGIYLKQVSEILVPLPPLDVQRKIADVLDKASALIELRRAQIDKLDLLIKSQFIEMFGNPVTNPMGWTKENVEQMVQKGVLDRPLDGNHGEKHPKACDFVPSGIPFVMANNLVDGRVDYASCNFITEKQANSLDKGFSHNGDVLLTHKGTIGRTAIIDGHYDFIILTPQVTYYRPLTGVTAEYLKAYFDTTFFQTEMMKIAGIGTTRSYIGITAQQKLPIMLPPIGLQQQFSSFVEQIEKSKLALQQSLEKLELNYKSLMQKCFRGELF